MSDHELDEKFSELQVSSEPPKRGRGRPKKEKPLKVKKEPLTEEQKAENYRKSQQAYNRRRVNLGSHLVTMVKCGSLIPANEDSMNELKEWAEKFSIKFSFEEKK